MTASSSSSSSSRCPGRVRQVVLAVLLLWSVVSLVVIVVWCTSPDLKGSAHCRAELAQRTEQHRADQETWSKDKEALEEQLLEERQETQHQVKEVLTLRGQLNQTTEELQECRQREVALNGNISLLLLEAQLLEQTRANLTQQLHLLAEQAEALQQNLTQSLHSNAACLSHKVALQSQKVAAESETRGCQSSEQYLKKQLDKCQQANALWRSQQRDSAPSTPCSGAVAPPLSTPLLLLPLVPACVSLLSLT